MGELMYMELLACKVASDYNMPAEQLYTFTKSDKCSLDDC